MHEVISEIDGEATCRTITWLISAYSVAAAAAAAAGDAVEDDGDADKNSAAR